MDQKLPSKVKKNFSKENGDKQSPINAIEALKRQRNFLKHHLERLKVIEGKLNELDHLASKKQ